MHDINLIRKDQDKFVKEMRKRFTEVNIDKIILLDTEKRNLTFELQGLQNRRNKLSKLIPKINNQQDEIEKIIKEVNKIKEDIKVAEKKLNEKSNNLDKILLNLPNKPAPDVPVGKDEKFNKVIYEYKHPDKKEEGFSHDELGLNLKMMDFEVASKISGSRFVILKSKLARLERALCNFMLDLHTKEHG